MLVETERRRLLHQARHELWLTQVHTTPLPRSLVSALIQRAVAALEEYDLP